MGEFAARGGLRQTMTTTVATAAGVIPAIVPIRVRPLLQPAGYREFPFFAERAVDKGRAHRIIR